jgi:hypothetical protein
MNRMLETLKGSEALLEIIRQGFSASAIAVLCGEAS